MLAVVASTDGWHTLLFGLMMATTVNLTSFISEDQVAAIQDKLSKVTLEDSDER